MIWLCMSWQTDIDDVIFLFFNDNYVVEINVVAINHMSVIFWSAVMLDHIWIPVINVCHFFRNVFQTVSHTLTTGKSYFPASYRRGHYQANTTFSIAIQLTLRIKILQKFTTMDGNCYNSDHVVLIWAQTSLYTIGIPKLNLHSKHFFKVYSSISKVEFYVDCYLSTSSMRFPKWNSMRIAI